MTENVLQNLTQLVPLNDLKKMRKLPELAEFLGLYDGNVATIAGLQLRMDPNTVRGETARSRQGSVLHLSNTPAMQQLAQPYVPDDIMNEAIGRLQPLRDYDEELQHFEGSFEDKFSSYRGHRNPFHLLEQGFIMGPGGSEAKRGPNPLQWDLAMKAVDTVVRAFKDAGVSQVQPRHLVPCTPASTGRGLKISHVLKNSAGDPFFSDPSVSSTSKRENLGRAIEMVTRFFQPGETALPLWPGRAFARGDRAAPKEVFKDTETARDLLVHTAKDRLIIAQSFVLQMMDGLVTQALMNATSLAPLPEIDMREPWHLSGHFESGMQITQNLGEKAFSIGTDESGWDHHFAPQSWYLAYKVYEALLPETFNIGVVYADEPVVFDENDQLRLEAMAPGERGELTLQVMNDFDKSSRTFEAEMFVVPRETYLRRLFAGASATPVAYGDLILDGYRTVIDTPTDGKFLCGYGMRSGNFLTFYVNSVVNLIKLKYIQLASQDPVMRANYQKEFGIEPPHMDLRWSVVRGDDAGQVWEILDEEVDPAWIPSEILANWLTLCGGLANSKKQETSDTYGRWMLGFAQIFTNENFPRGVASMVRVLERNTFNERDEVVLDDPDTGEDLRPYILLMNKVGRVSRLWELFGQEIHPLAEEMTALIQDLDVEGRMLPPRTEEERAKASRAFYLRLLRRGTLPVDADIIFDLWSSGLAPFTEGRYRDNQSKLDSDWSPIPHYGDARPKWR